jgi:hypothetical protein
MCYSFILKCQDCGTKHGIEVEVIYVNVGPGPTEDVKGLMINYKISVTKMRTPNRL